MNAKKPVNIAASVKARLKNYMLKEQADFQQVLGRYAAERFLYRLSQSDIADRFVLKGASLFRIWADREYRPTRDVDFLGYGDSDADSIREMVATICAVPCEEDGLTFDVGNISVKNIREDLAYGGQRVKLTAFLEKTRILVQLDIGFGDTITPGAVKMAYPTIIDTPEPVLMTYPRETVVAEKFEAMVKLGPLNSRMKDFWDVTLLADQFEFKFDVLCEAIQATCKRRKTDLKDEMPEALQASFYQDAALKERWERFRNMEGDAPVPLLFPEVGERLRRFLTPVYNHVIGIQSPNKLKLWPKGGLWK